MVSGELQAKVRRRLASVAGADLHSVVTNKKAAEDSRTPRRWRVIRSASKCRKVLECGCPLPLLIWLRMQLRPSIQFSSACAKFAHLSSEIAWTHRRIFGNFQPTTHVSLIHRE